jgi:hypothetical protein
LAWIDPKLRSALGLNLAIKEPLRFQLQKDQLPSKIYVGILFLAYNPTPFISDIDEEIKFLPKQTFWRLCQISSLQQNLLSHISL